MFLSGLPHILSKLRLPDHLEGVISCLGGLGNIVPESIGHHFQLCLWCIGIEEVGMTTYWMDTGTVKTGLYILLPEIHPCAHLTLIVHFFILILPEESLSCSKKSKNSFSLRTHR